ncbi:hypothetical protein G6O69_06600 [Pseudenhygromyxa sp. WMMC2535]|uniref:hypothetical protein n=1 Tax=Pseudenhygromyxa sp. WMMC2535 TaxID=2712867 RepID=UPI00155184FD|nr:hypothetical protein [Pseudenhygromyxa sp. WMMC2535]NVB37495.1 hypothetical protein [Pseudenhygromyxa sp. WMMC2535]
MNDENLARFTERPWVLIRRTLGDREAIRGKAQRAAYTVANYAFPRRIEDRLRNLQNLGYVGSYPNRTQMIFGAIDMFRFFIIPCAADYYHSKNITFSFHALLRFLDDPASMMDPTGFMTHQDAIIGHLMQVTHADPIYDLQLLAAIPGGLEELERQIEQMLDGTHPRAESIGAIIEDPEYHHRLLQHVREFLANPAGCKPLLRENVLNNPHFARIAEVFGDLPSAIGYFASLPERRFQALMRLLRTPEFPYEPTGEQVPAANDDVGADISADADTSSTTSTGPNPGQPDRTAAA